MRQITDIKRNKRTFNLTLDEFRKGEWLKEVPDSDLVEITYKNRYLTINDCHIKKLVDLKKRKSEKEKEGDKDE